MKIDQLISSVQAALSVEADGKAGPETWTAIHTRIVGAARDAAASDVAIDTVDPRSEKVISKLLPEVQPLARALVQKAASNGIKIKVISGLRSYEEQDALYAQGRTTEGNIVTNAKGGFSNHNFGVAFDIGVFEGTSYLGESAKYRAVGVLGSELGLEWGGNWKTIVDQPHFQLRPSWAKDLIERDLLKVLRARVAAGDPIYS